MGIAARFVCGLSCAMAFSLSQAAGLGLDGSGITFPDGSIQTTAAGGAGKCMEITQADIPLAITTPGVHCLVENISSASTAITISAHDVALNLNGHTITGTAGSATSSIGVSCSARRNAVISNGTITGFFYGVMLNNCDYAQVTHLRSVKNYSAGIDLLGATIGTLIAHNHITDIGGTTRSGFTSATGITIRSSSSNNSGIRIIDNDIEGIHSRENGAARGIRLLSNGGMVLNNRISGLNPEAGGSQSLIFYSGQGGLLLDNTMSGSGSTAISVNGTATALCADNKAMGFTSATFQCNNGGGNVAFP